jgi:hypothetical protein
MAKTPRTRALATFGLNVRKRREALKLSRIEAAEKASVSWVTFLAKPGSLASET